MGSFDDEDEDVRELRAEVEAKVREVVGASTGATREQVEVAARSAGDASTKLLRLGVEHREVLAAVAEHLDGAGASRESMAATLSLVAELSLSASLQAWVACKVAESADGRSHACATDAVLEAFTRLSAVVADLTREELLALVERGGAL